MARALAYARTAVPADIAPTLRVLIVTGCALALVFAGQPFPF